jgi:hypothetical protein
MLRHVSRARTDVSEERVTSIIRVFRFLVTANVLPSSPILVTLMMESIHSPETSVFTRATRRNMPEDGIVQNKQWSILPALRALGNTLK